ncbi:MAG TPA: hypothetical protein VLK36_12960 [Gaiellaceae bacterium]|nr:hypothetical protein [Gaiellaceae bacterium]
MLRAAVLSACVSFVMPLAAATSDAAPTKSVTIRVLVQPVTRSIKDVPPKTLSRGEYSKGDTITGTSVLRNYVRQFGKPKGARVGTSKGVTTALSPQTARSEAVARLPGGTVHASGTGNIGPTAKVPIVGGTGVYAGATGVVEGSHLASGVTLEVLRMRVP